MLLWLGNVGCQQTEPEDDVVELISDVEAKGKVDGSVNEDRVPSTRIWRAEQE